MRLRRSLAPLLAALFAVTAHPSASLAAHTYDTKAQTASYATTNPTTLSYTCGSGTTLLVLMLQHTQAARTGGSPTYNAVAMTQVGAAVLNNAEVGVEMWYAVLPPTGSAYTISVPNSGAQAMRITAASFKAQSGYYSALDQNTSTNVDGANPSLSRTTTVNGDVCIDVLGDGLLSVPTARTHTLLYNNDEGALVFETQYALQGTLGAITMTHTIATDDVAMIMACFKEVSGSATAALSTPSTYATASRGTITASSAVDATITPSGSTATLTPGSVGVAVTVDAAPTIAGTPAAAEIGSLEVVGGTVASVGLVGELSTAARGSLVVAGEAALVLPGLGATASRGALTASANGAVALAGSFSTSSRGSLSVVGDGAPSLSGSSAPTSAGVLGTAAGGNLSPAGASAAASRGSLAVSAQASVGLSGSFLIASAGTLDASTGATFSPAIRLPQGVIE